MGISVEDSAVGQVSDLPLKKYKHGKSWAGRKPAPRAFRAAASVILCLAEAARAQDSGQSATGPLRITLQDAQARAAAASKVAQLAKLNVKAARYHRQAAQADYFPKIGSAFANVHFNKFMGERIQLVRRTAELPLLNKDQTLVAATATQPITPLLQVREAVGIARADERIAEAKASAAAAATAANVEKTYFALLIAQRRREGAAIKLKMTETPLQIASTAPAVFDTTERQTALLEANKSQLAATSDVDELTQELNALMGLPANTQLELDAPPPVTVDISSGQVSQQTIDSSPEVIEAQQMLAKARAASRLSKLEYVPTVAGIFGYTFQTALPLLPRDFSFYGVIASWTIFDFGKRERTVMERRTQVQMADLNLQIVREKAAAKVQKTSVDVERTGRLLQIARRLTSMYQALPVSYRETNLEAKAAWAQAEAEMFQAELDYRLAYAEWKRAAGER